MAPGGAHAPRADPALGGGAARAAGPGHAGAAGQEHHAAGHHQRHPKLPAPLRHPRAHAGAHVAPQGLRPHPQGLPQNHPLPEVAAHGRAAR